MVTTYNKESHTTTTFKDINAGYGIFTDNEIYYADDETHYVDGAVRFSNTYNHLKCSNNIITVNSIRYNLNGIILTYDTIQTIRANNSALLARTGFYLASGYPTQRDTKSGYGIRCDDDVILCNSKKYDCQGAIMYNEVSYGS